MTNKDSNKAPEYLITHFFDTENIDFITDIKELIYPSLAIIRSDGIPLDFGDAAFILNKDIISEDSRLDSEIFDRDAFTIRSPRFEKREILYLADVLSELSDNLDAAPELLSLLNTQMIDVKMEDFEECEYSDDQFGDKETVIYTALDIITKSILLRVYPNIEFDEDGFNYSAHEIFTNNPQYKEEQNEKFEKFQKFANEKSEILYLNQETNQIYDKFETIYSIHDKLEEVFNGELINSEVEKYTIDMPTMTSLKSPYANIIEKEDLNENLYKIGELSEILKFDDEVIKDTYAKIMNVPSDINLTLSHKFNDMEYPLLSDSMLINTIRAFNQNQYQTLYMYLNILGVVSSSNPDDVQASFAYIYQDDDSLISKNEELYKKINHFFTPINDLIYKISGMPTPYFEVKVCDILPINNKYIHAVILNEEYFEDEVFEKKITDYFNKAGIEVHKYGPNESPKIENHVFSDDEYENKKIFLSHKIQELSNRFSLNNENTEENQPEKKSSLKFK